MRVKINGEDKDTSAKTIADLLEELEIVPGRVAVEVNYNVIKKADYNNFRLKECDIVEIVYFVGGGDKDFKF